MKNNDNNFDVVIIGAGVAGIAAGYYLSQSGLRVALLDKLSPMSFTSAQSGENYRNWWPHPTMTAFTNHSIALMETLSKQTDNILAMSRRGYLLASRGQNSSPLVEQLYAGYGGLGDSLIRLHNSDDNSTYAPTTSENWQGVVDGVDVLQNRDLINKYFPYLDQQVNQLIHIRRAGAVSFYPLGQFMLAKIKQAGGRLFQGTAKHIEHGSGEGFSVAFEQDGQENHIHANKLVNAAGPFASEVSSMLGVSLPIKNFIQQKIAFEDSHKAIPRDMPFVVDLDDCILPWDDEDKEILAADDETRWLVEPISGGIHCRPDGGENGSWIKLGWAFNKKASTPSFETELNPLFPDLVLRGASRLNPALKAYIGKLPRKFTHYGGYYSMTEENWPIIGPLGLTEGVKDAYVIGALSGFGTMAACGAGSLITAWITDDDLPDYANDLSLKRYNNQPLMEVLKTLSTGAL